MEHSGAGTLSLYGRDGRRKYLTTAERLGFIAAAQAQSRPHLETFCLILAFTGCRISEALSLTASSIETAEGFVAIRTLKKRGRLIVREIPLPTWLIRRLVAVHELRTADPGGRLWPWSRGHAWSLIKSVMCAARIRPGPHASPKGLRHGFGIHAIRSGVPLTLVQRWLGHARLATTAIYTEALGDEEREIARRMWQHPRRARTSGTID
jgi:integrase/recombinase XerD